MKLKLFIISTVISAALLGGCCSICKQRVKNAKPLENTEWHLIQIGNNTVSYATDKFNIMFSDGKLSGIGACNRIMGQYTVGQKSKIDIFSIASTRMMCHESECESQLITILDSATHYDIDFDTLLIMQDGVIKAIFKAVNNTDK